MFIGKLTSVPATTPPKSPVTSRRLYSPGDFKEDYITKVL